MMKINQNGIDMANVVENQNVNDHIQVDLEFLDHVFTLMVPKDTDLEELFEIIEKFILETPNISIDLKSLAKTILDTEYYSLLLKQQGNVISDFKEIQIGLPLRVELESDVEKKRYYNKKHLKSTFQHIQSMSVNEFINMFHINNMQLFKQKLLEISDRYPIKINDDVIEITSPLTKEQLKFFARELVEYMN